jgi:hypothetical protein
MLPKCGDKFIDRRYLWNCEHFTINQAYTTILTLTQMQQLTGFAMGGEVEKKEM